MFWGTPLAVQFWRASPFEFGMDPLEPRWGPEHLAEADPLQAYVFKLLCEGSLSLDELAAAIEDESLPVAEAQLLGAILDAWGMFYPRFSLYPFNSIVILY